MNDPFNIVGMIWFLAIGVGLPVAGWLAMGLDYRAYLRSLRRKLIVARRYTFDLPAWARHERPACFEELGLSPGATRDDVLAAYRRKVKQVHPDRGGDRRQFDRLQRRLEEALSIVESAG